MNKIAFIVVLSTWFTMSGGVMAEEEKSVKQLCEEYAKEDGISKDELDDYIAQCIFNLSGVEETEIPEQESGGDDGTNMKFDMASVAHFGLLFG